MDLHINYLDKSKSSPLHLAVRGGNMEAIGFCIANGGKIDQQQVQMSQINWRNKSRLVLICLSPQFFLTAARHVDSPMRLLIIHRLLSTFASVILYTGAYLPTPVTLAKRFLVLSLLEHVGLNKPFLE